MRPNSKRLLWCEPNAGEWHGNEDFLLLQNRKDYSFSVISLSAHEHSPPILPQSNSLKIVVTRNALLNPLCLKNRLAYTFKNASPVSCWNPIVTDFLQHSS